MMLSVDARCGLLLSDEINRLVNKLRLYVKDSNDKCRSTVSMLTILEEKLNRIHLNDMGGLGRFKPKMELPYSEWLWELFRASERVSGLLEVMDAVIAKNKKVSSSEAISQWLELEENHLSMWNEVGNLTSICSRGELLIVSPGPGEVDSLSIEFQSSSKVESSPIAFASSSKAPVSSSSGPIISSSSEASSQASKVESSMIAFPSATKAEPSLIASLCSGLSPDPSEVDLQVTTLASSSKAPASTSSGPIIPISSEASSQESKVESSMIAFPSATKAEPSPIASLCSDPSPNLPSSDEVECPFTVLVSDALSGTITTSTIKDLLSRKAPCETTPKLHPRPQSRKSTDMIATKPVPGLGSSKAPRTNSKTIVGTGSGKASSIISTEPVPGLGSSKTPRTNSDKDEALLISSSSSGQSPSPISVQVGKSLNPRLARLPEKGQVQAQGQPRLNNHLVANSVQGGMAKTRTTVTKLRSPNQRLTDPALNQTIGSKTLATTFFVVDIKGSYNVIFLRDWIHANECVPSSLHQYLNLWVGDAIETAHANSLAAR